MAIVKSTLRFAFATIYAGLLESRFADLVRAIGGTYYAAGGSTSQNPGTLTGANFKTRAGLSNDLKNEPYSLALVQFRVAGAIVGTASFRAPISGLGIQHGRDCSVLSVSASYDSLNAGGSTGITGTCTVYVVGPYPYFTQTTAAAPTFTNSAPRTATVNSAISPVVIPSVTFPAGSMGLAIDVEFNISAFVGGTSTQAQGVVIGVLLKMKHVA